MKKSEMPAHEIAIMDHIKTSPDVWGSYADYRICPVCQRKTQVRGDYHLLRFCHGNRISK